MFVRYSISFSCLPYSFSGSLFFSYVFLPHCSPILFFSPMHTLSLSHALLTPLSSPTLSQIHILFQYYSRVFPPLSSSPILKISYTLLFSHSLLIFFSLSCHHLPLLPCCSYTYTLLTYLTFSYPQRLINMHSIPLSQS